MNSYPIWVLAEVKAGKVPRLYAVAFGMGQSPKNQRKALLCFYVTLYTQPNRDKYLFVNMPQAYPIMPDKIVQNQKTKIYPYGFLRK
jgi:hypothetical protein